MNIQPVPQAPPAAAAPPPLPLWETKANTLNLQGQHVYSISFYASSTVLVGNNVPNYEKRDTRRSPTSSTGNINKSDPC